MFVFCCYPSSPQPRKRCPVWMVIISGVLASTDTGRLRWFRAVWRLCSQVSFWASSSSSTFSIRFIVQEVAHQELFKGSLTLALGLGSAKRKHRQEVLQKGWRKVRRVTHSASCSTVWRPLDPFREGCVQLSLCDLSWSSLGSGSYLPPTHPQSSVLEAVTDGTCSDLCKQSVHKLSCVSPLSVCVPSVSSWKSDSYTLWIGLEELLKFHLMLMLTKRFWATTLYKW